MAFSPNLFLANVRSKDGLAKPSRFEVILPIPPYISQFIGSSIFETIFQILFLVMYLMLSIKLLNVEDRHQVHLQQEI